MRVLLLQVEVYTVRNPKEPSVTRSHDKQSHTESSGPLAVAFKTPFQSYRVLFGLVGRCSCLFGEMIAIAHANKT
jgi:hypothetical protein